MRELPDMRSEDYGKTSRPAPGDSHADQAWERPVPDPGYSLRCIACARGKKMTAFCVISERILAVETMEFCLGQQFDQDCLHSEKSEREY